MHLFILSYFSLLAGVEGTFFSSKIQVWQEICSKNYMSSEDDASLFQLIHLLSNLQSYPLNSVYRFENILRRKIKVVANSFYCRSRIAPSISKRKSSIRAIVKYQQTHTLTHSHTRPHATRIPFRSIRIECVVCTIHIPVTPNAKAI